MGRTTAVSLLASTLAIASGACGQTEIPDEPFFYQPPPGHQPVGVNWTQRARLVQPWGKGQHRLITQAETMAPQLAERYGINTIVLQPPLAFNRIGDEFKVSDSEFQHALSIYRQHGFRIVLYTSIMHAGHEPVWQSGVLARTYPEWTQRDADGHERVSYGSSWLNPFGDPRQYALDYTLEMIDRFQPDAVMLDNNQFYIANTGPDGGGGITGYGPAAARAFAAWARLQMPDASLGDPVEQMPTTPGPTFNLFMIWRCAVWAEANRTFRQALPDNVALLANIQYLYKTPVLGSDLQYDHLDTIVSETNNRPSWAMSAKMLLGHALLGPDKPLWNYMGTVQKSGDYDEMWPADKTARIVASTIGMRANPWLLYYGFHSKDETNAESRAAIGRLMRFYADHLDLHLNGKPGSNIGYVFSTRNRRHFNEYPIPKSYYKLQEAGVSCVGLYDARLATSLADERLTGRLRYIVADSLRTLHPAEAQALADWVRRGGVLITTPDAGTLDDLARPVGPEGESLLAAALGVSSLETAPIGHGSLIVDTSNNLPFQVSRITDATRFTAQQTDNGQALFVEGRWFIQSDGEPVVHLINHGDPVDDSVVVRLPINDPSQWVVMTPGEPDAVVEVRRADSTVEVTLPRLHAYTVLTTGSSHR